MVKIEATLSTQALEEVTGALQEMGCAGLTVSEVQVDPNETNHRSWYRGQAVRRRQAALRIEVVVPARRLEEALDVLAAAGGSAPGDGEILVTPIQGAVRIRTGETGEDAVAG